MPPQREPPKRDKARDPNSARKKRRAAQFGSRPQPAGKEQQRAVAPQPAAARPERQSGGKQRRAMSMPRAPGRIYADGPRELAEALVAALRAPTIDHEIAESLTHPLHSYPARLHPATARILVDVVG